MILALFVISLSALSNNLDTELDSYISTFKYAPVKRLVNNRPSQYRLGKKLFFDKRLSLNNNISCSTCHDPDFASSDALPVSIGLGGKGIGTNRRQHSARLTKRSSPAIFNKGHADFDKMFWDGRVFHSKAGGGRFYTPEPGLNGVNPEYSDIASVLDSALAAQALFPLTSDIEMKGESKLSNRELWRKITKRIISLPEYQSLFKATYKIDLDSINIAHIANAIAYFEGRHFQATNTNWDKYLRGNKNAMSDSEKRGAIVFSTKARCSRCHHGKHLTNFAFQNIGIPPLESNDHKGADIGRHAISKQEYDKYAFATPPLRNAALTAPYFHNGAYQTLEEVIDHYADANNSIYFFKTDSMNKFFKRNFSSKFSALKDPSVLRFIEDRLNPQVRMGFKLTAREREDLLNFLKNSLTSK